MKIQKSTLAIGIIVGLVVGIAFGCYVLCGSDAFVERFVVRVRLNPSSQSWEWRSVYDFGLMVAFTQNGHVVTECMVKTSWVEVSVPKGQYVVNLYDVESGLFIKDFGVYVAKDLDLEVSL